MIDKRNREWSFLKQPKRQSLCTQCAAWSKAKLDPALRDRDREGGLTCPIP